jgi:hypothetical protein
MGAGHQFGPVRCRSRLRPAIGRSARSGSRAPSDKRPDPVRLLQPGRRSAPARWPPILAILATSDAPVCRGKHGHRRRIRGAEATRRRQRASIDAGPPSGRSPAMAPPRPLMRRMWRTKYTPVFRAPNGRRRPMIAHVAHVAHERHTGVSCAAWAPATIQGPSGGSMAALCRRRLRPPILDWRDPIAGIEPPGRRRAARADCPVYRDHVDCTGSPGLSGWVSRGLTGSGTSRVGDLGISGSTWT